MAKRTCIADGCERPGLRRQMCTLHYQRIRKYGSTDLPAQPSFEERFWSKVLKTQNCWTWTGGISEGYGRIAVSQTEWVFAHRFSYEQLVGPIPHGIQVDHICHNRACVNPAHLRLADHKQNQENLAGPTAANTSGVRGVSRRNGKWRARVKHHGLEHNLGLFRRLADAEAAVIAKRNELFTHNNSDRTS